MDGFFSNLVSEHIRDLPVYRPGKPAEEVEREFGIHGALKLASNENPMGPSPRAIEAAARALAKAHIYPHGDSFYLRHALAERRGVSAEQVLMGTGSNELIYYIAQALCRPGHDQILTHKNAFVTYRLAAQSCGVEVIETAVDDDLRCDVDALIAAMGPRTKVVFLANPNNPTGAYIPKPDLERILAALPERALLVVDEAYQEYALANDQGGDYPLSQGYQSAEEPRILTLRTFSKVYGLAGLRVGYGIGNERVVGYIDRVRRVFNVNSIAQAAARAALDDEAHVERSCNAVRTGLASLSQGVEKLGLRAYPSLGNFILVGVGRDAAPIYEGMLRRGVIVRPLAGWGLPQHLRISAAGTPADTDRALSALAAAVEAADKDTMA